MYAGQSPDLPMAERARRIQRGLRDQGGALRDAALTAEGKRWSITVSQICVADALKAFKQADGLPLAGKVAAVERAAHESGFLLSDVLLASQVIWNEGVGIV
jgi:hypothetical protein